MNSGFLNPYSRWYYSLHWLILIVLGLAIYAQTFWFNFVFDDVGFIVNNPDIKSFEHIHYLWKIFPHTRTLGFYSFALNYFIGQLNPAGYHIFNFIIHLLAAGLVWACASLLFKITGWLPSKPEIKNNKKKLKVIDPIPQELPFLIAVLFLVHPCQIQAVSYISQRFESMATLFYLASIYSYLCARVSSSRLNQILLFIACAVFAVLGILTKEVAVTIPLMILATELIIFNNNQIKISFFSLLGAVLFFLLFSKLLSTNLNIYFHFQPTPSDSHDGDIITLKNYLITQMHVFLTFIRLFILPVQQNLDYDYPLSNGFFSSPLSLAGLSLIGLMIYTIFKIRKKFPVIAFGLAWILITFSINLAPRVNVIFEHKLYLISFGFILVLVSTLFVIYSQKKLLLWVLLIMITVMSGLSFVRNQVWKNEITLWDDVVQKSPHKARPIYNHGFAYFHQGNYAQALIDFTKTINLKPDFVDAYINRGIIYESEGDYSKALLDYNTAIEINPQVAEVYYNRGNTYAKQNNLSLALSDYNKAIQLDPGYSEAYGNRGSIYVKQGDITQALFNYNRSIQINPFYTDAYYNRGLVYALQGNFTLAKSDYIKAIEINPYNSRAYINLGTFWAQQGEYAKALLNYNKAIELKSDFAEAFFNRAVTYFHLKQYDKAWDDLHQTKNLGFKINPKFEEDLRKSSGRNN